MRRIILACLITIIVVVNMGHVYATPRVICDVEIETDHSARVSLKWSDTGSSKGIMVTGWDFDKGHLTVYYKTGDEVPSGFAERKISNDDYDFPLPVVLALVTGQEPEFNDIGVDDPGYDAIANLYYRGIIGGYTDGSFRPMNNVTRAEFSKMLLESADYPLEDQLSTFEDVKGDFWGKPYIMTLSSKGILKGKGGGKFDPNGEITIGEVITVLTRTFDLYSKEGAYPYSFVKDHWSKEYFLDAVGDGLVTSDDDFYHPYTPDVRATRKDCAILLSRVLENLHDVTEVAD